MYFSFSRRERTLLGFSSEPLLIFLACGHACSCLPATFAPSSIQHGIYWAEQPWKDRTSHSTNGFIFLVPSFSSTCWSSLPSPPYSPSPWLADTAWEPAVLVGIAPWAVNGHDAAATWAEQRSRSQEPAVACSCAGQRRIPAWPGNSHRRNCPGEDKRCNMEDALPKNVVEHMELRGEIWSVGGR